jgi:predicted transcriptional regulator
MAEVLTEQGRFTQRRSTLEIRMDILKVAAEGSVKPTHIMYRSNTSWIALHKNLESLLASGFIRKSGEGSKIEYTITDSGREVLHDYLGVLEKTMASPMEDREWRCPPRF